MLAGPTDLWPKSKDIAFDLIEVKLSRVRYTLASSNPTSATLALYGAAVALLNLETSEQLRSSLIAALMPVANH